MILGNIFHKTGCITESIDLNMLIENLVIPTAKEWQLLVSKELSDKVKQIPVSIDETLNRVAESHVKYADLHFLIEGNEIHEFWNGFNLQEPKEEFLLEDNIFYPEINVQKRILIQLQPGDFVVYWPGEIHIAGIGETKAKKIVYKIKV